MGNNTTHMDSPAVDVLVSATFFATAFGIVYVVVTARHRQRMAMIEKGMDPGMQREREVPLRSLRNGLVILAIGLGLFLGLLMERYSPIPNADGSNSGSPLPYFIMVTFCVGAALIMHHFIARKQGRQEVK